MGAIRPDFLLGVTKLLQARHDLFAGQTTTTGFYDTKRSICQWVNLGINNI